MTHFVFWQNHWKSADVWFTVSGPLAKEGEFPAFAALYHYNTDRSSPHNTPRGDHTKLCIFMVAAKTQWISINTKLLFFFLFLTVVRVGSRWVGD